MPRFESAFAQTTMILIVMAGVVALCFTVKAFKKRLTDGMIILLAGVVGALADGWWPPPIRQYVEGEFYFFYLILTIGAGMVMVDAFKESGILYALTRTLLKRFYKYPSLLLSFLMFIIMFPGMVTGSAPACVLTTGVMIYPILMKMGIPRLETAAILAIGSIAGQIAPPVNVPIMIICTSVFMPYEGFMLPLLLLTFPWGIFSILWIGRKFVTVQRLKEIADEPEEEGMPESSFKLYIPVLVMAILMTLPRVFTGKYPDTSTASIFMLTSIVALFTGRKFNFFKSSRNTFDSATGTIILFTGIGVLIESMGLTGVRGLIATTTISLPRVLLYVAFCITGILLPGVLVTFGTAAVIGPPYILALQDMNAIMVSSGASLIMGLGCLIPPTGIGGLFAMRVVGETAYWPIFKKCLMPAIVALILSLIFMIYANEIGTIPGLRYVPTKGG
jgi:gluconate:H+ symporter, GntP family